MDASSCRVYAAWGCSSTFSVGPCSTMRPSFMTTTWSHTFCTTPMSCETSTSVSCCSARRRAISRRICARTVTSSADSGSSPTRMRGRCTIARARAMR